MRLKALFFILILSGILKSQVAPFVTATWAQTCYYNALTPTVSSGGSCGRAYVGCNATALAMICKYYSYPANGIGGTYCNSNFTTNCVNFGAQTYNFAAMPNNVTSANAEVAKLSYNLGVACDMQWSGSNSTSFFDGTVLKRYFAYSPKMYSTASFMFPNTAALITALKAELNAGRPVFAKGGGHFYLIDGYNASDNFHTNFGWSGTYNGYYPITAVTNAAGNFTPSNFLFMIKPLAGTLEFAKDTIVIPSSAGTNLMDFTSLSNFTVSTLTSWLTPSLSTGTPGYYDFGNGGTFNALLNNGGVRYGTIVIQNATSTKTLVVQQDASPLIVNPTPLNYAAAGSTQSVNVSYFSWGTWTVTTPTSWLSLSASGGTGNGTFDVIASANTATVGRSGYVIVQGGAYTDSIPVTQAAYVSTVTTFVKNLNTENTVRLLVYPNPANNFVDLEISDELISNNYTITDELGRILLQDEIRSNKEHIDVSLLNEGMYYLKINGNSKKLIVIRN